MCIEIDIPDNMVVQSNLPDIYYTNKTIYVSPSNVSFVFESEEILNKSLFWIDISDEAKFYDQYKDKFVLHEIIDDVFNLTTNTLDDLIIENTSDIEIQALKDWKMDRLRGALCGLFIGANGFEGLDKAGIGYRRNKIKDLMAQLLHIFDGHGKLMSLTYQLQKSALSEFVKKEQNINQLCSIQTFGRLNVKYSEEKDVHIDFYNQLLNLILANSESLTQQTLSQEGGKLLSTLYGNCWKYSSDYNYLIQLYNNVTRYDNFDLSSNESVILRSFAAFVQRGLGEWDKLRDYLSEREMSLPDRRFVYGLYGAINGFSTLSKTLTDTADISNKAIVDFIIDMNEISIINDDDVTIEKGAQEDVQYDSELSSGDNKEGELSEVADEVGLHIWQKGIKDYAVEKAIKRDKKKLISALEEALIKNGKKTDYFVFLKLLATYEGWTPTGKGPNAVWVRMQEHFAPDYFSRMGIVNPKTTLKSVEANNSPSLFGPSFEENGEDTNIKRPFFEDNYAWETIRTMVPLQIRERIQKDFTWLQHEYQKGEQSKYYARASRDNTTVIEALRRLLLKRDYIKGMFEKEIEQIIQYLHHHYDQ